VKYEMRRHLEQKYGYIEFEESSFYHESIFIIGIGYRWNLYPVGGDPEADGFHLYKGDKSGSIVDSYYGLLIREDYEKMVKEVADQYFDECKVHCSLSNMAFPNELTAAVSLEQALDSNLIGLNDPFAWVIVPNSYGNDEAAFQKDAEMFATALTGRRLPLVLRAFCVSRSDFEASTRENDLEIIEKKKMVFEEFYAAYNGKGERYQ
jgi:hypothetical protein